MGDNKQQNKDTERGEETNGVVVQLEWGEENKIMGSV